MGPGIAILAFGEPAAVPVALIFCFENIMHFTIAPMMMALAGGDHRSAGSAGAGCGAQDCAFTPSSWPPRSVSPRPGSNSYPPVPVGRLIDYLAQAAAPCALFAMGVTLALRPLKRVPVELGFIVPMKLIAHPVMMYLG
jgi:malonate transporter